jgi:hypothetical protein
MCLAVLHDGDMLHYSCCTCGQGCLRHHLNGCENRTCLSIDERTDVAAACCVVVHAVVAILLAQGYFPKVPETASAADLGSIHVDRLA